MLEKIGLPAKPSLRGNTWVVDASHCQGCSSQFTFINRKHHCRRCGGIFCNSCTQQRMNLRGQGDSPVRICEPCKKLEEAARFELRHGYKSRAGKGSSRLAAKNEDEILNQILGTDGKESIRSGLSSKSDLGPSIQRATSSASSSNTQDASGHGVFGDVGENQSVDDHNFVQNESGSASPEGMRQQALEEKKKYKVLRGEGKPEEALRAYKRGKELERQAEALEILIRKNRKKVLSSGTKVEIQINDGSKESGSKNKPSPKVSNEKDDLTAELRELGWSDRDLQGGGKNTASMSLEGELSSLIRDVSQKTNKDISTRGLDKTPVLALKRKALMLKREGKLAEAKEELKRAKVLEKQLEEQELLAEAGDSDDELSAIIQSMDNDEQDASLIQYEQKPDLDFGQLVGTTDELVLDSNFEVTNEDMEDPEMDAALKALGWTEDSNRAEDIVSKAGPLDRDALSKEILSLKREALNKKRAGNVAEAMSLLKKAKLLEKDMESSQFQTDGSFVPNPNINHTGSISQVTVKSSDTGKMDDGNFDLTKDMDSKVAPKTKLMIQRELLALKKKALTLRREGRVDEADEELKKGKALESQLEEMDNVTKVKATGSKDPILAREHAVVSGNLPVVEGEDDVTDQDMHDPTYLATLRNLGWNDEDNGLESQSSKPSKMRDNLSVQNIESSSTLATSDVKVRASRSKAEIQRELLGLKRRALALRRRGKTDEADEVLEAAKAVEAQMEDMEASKKVQVESHQLNDKFIERPLESAVGEGDEEDITEKDMNDPVLHSQLTNFGWKNEELEPVTMQEKPSKGIASNSLHSSDPSVMQSSSGISVTTLRSKGEIQRELLGLKRKALTLRRKGETEEAEELLNKAKVLEGQMEELEAPKEHLLDASKDKKSQSFDSLVNHEKHRNLDGEVGVNTGLATVSVSLNDKALESSQFNKADHPLLGEWGPSGETGFQDIVGVAEGTGFIPPPTQTKNLMDLLTGNDWTSSQVTSGKLEDKGISGSDSSSLARPSVQLDPLSNPRVDGGSRNEVKTGNREEIVHADESPQIHEAKSVQASTSENQTSLRQEVLVHKRKALALKREGKLIEALEELRRAKLLEKTLEEDNIETKTSPPDVSIAASQISSAGQKEHGAPNLAPKPLSSRDRFKLQQESLSHKRLALKLRREGRMDEAEAEFEIAKNLEAQLEEHDSKSNVNETEQVDDVVVEDLLDPMLLSALKAIGIDDASMVPQRPERAEPVKPHPEKSSENSSQERIQLEERIKAEKVKAVNLKRSGKQAEALDALRRAKMYEKKLNSLATS
ncbi:hypothetical protein Ddye_019474 [Dipteronia dyeriana]|uniref:FYVE-type domain-containing protein n=1 Tax=Dipteronia dyeriana TaxID=168575 RepID=A0AAD9WUG5_9ROSI|nr:hypothetical protein Ddye_019474 [Dipteronia dyeriana]